MLRALTVFSPFVLATNLVFLFRCEVIGDIESLANLLRGLSLDHVGDRLATDIQEWLDIKVVRGLQGNVSRESDDLVSAWKQTKMISKSISWSTCINF